jgi:uncharacterized protein (TIGR02448 family)
MELGWANYNHKVQITQPESPIMRLKYAVATLAVLSLPVGSAMADSFWRNVISSGATTGSTYLTFKDHKLVVAAQDDAGSFVASDGTWKPPCRKSGPTTLACKPPTWNWPTPSSRKTLLPSDSTRSKKCRFPKRHFFVCTMTIHSRVTGYIQSCRATMPVLIRLLLIANLKRMPSSS